MSGSVLALLAGLTATVAGAAWVHPGLGLVVAGGTVSWWALTREVGE